MAFSKNFHEREIGQVLEELESSEHGLSPQEAKKRLKENGPNELPEAKRQSYFSIFLKQFKSPLIYILLFSGAVVTFMEEYTDAAVIFFVLFFNATVGTIQEGKAQNTFLALKKFIKGRASVLRDAKEILVSDREVVVGDVIILREGEKVPSDARIIASSSMKTDESALTGESLPKFKSAKTSPADTPVTSRENMVFKGTTVVSGSGLAVVCATGLKTYLGNIAEETLGIDAEFPLKNAFKKISKIIIYSAAFIVVVFSFLGWTLNYGFLDIFKTLVAILVSIIPEGLPIVVTLVLARGVWAMGKKNVLVKKLQAVEVLGETDVLAVDKTGTVTRNELVAEKIWCGRKYFEITGAGYDPEGEFMLDGSVVDPPNHPELLLCGKIAALGSNASLMMKKKPRSWHISGDPTDGALTVFSNKVGFKRIDLITEMPILDEIPFDYELKFHASLHKSGGNKNFLAMAGSPEAVLKLCQKEWGANRLKTFNDTAKKEAMKIFHEMSHKGLRVIALAYCEVPIASLDKNHLPTLVFAGFLGIKDALRKEVHAAVRRVEQAGIKIVMITGDHEVTAHSIAQEAGIFKKGDTIMSGKIIEELSEADLASKIKAVSVFSGVTPKHKLRIIQAYKSNGMVVAMTGDGVNDALSLTAADIGISMGRIGTEVAKAASDVILLDDNFSNITYGVSEGKNIFKSVRRVVLYLFSTSFGEALTILGALFIGFPLPILAAQILWLNLVTDGFLDMALAMEPEEPENKKNGGRKKIMLLDRLMGLRMVFMALPMAIFTIYLFGQYYEENLAKAWTISMTTMAVFQWINAWNCRSEGRSVFSRNFLANRYLLGAMLVVIALQFLAIYNPYFQGILKTVPLEAGDWLKIVLVALSILLVEETRKFFYRRARKS